MVPYLTLPNPVSVLPRSTRLMIPWGTSRVMIPQVRKILLVLHVIPNWIRTCNTKSIFLTWGIILTRLVTHGNIVSVGWTRARKRNHKKERQPASYSFFPDGWLSFFLVVSFSWFRARERISWTLLEWWFHVNGCLNDGYSPFKHHLHVTINRAVCPG